MEVLTERTTMTRKNYNEDKRVKKEEKAAISLLTMLQFYMRVTRLALIVVDL